MDLSDLLTEAIDAKLAEVNMLLHATTVERIVDAVLEVLTKERLIENV